jgi:hypothetical protein
LPNHEFADCDCKTHSKYGQITHQAEVQLLMLLWQVLFRLAEAS